MEESREHMAEDLGSGSWHSPRDTENGMCWPSSSHVLFLSLYLRTLLTSTHNFYDAHLDTAAPTTGHLRCSVAMI